MADGIALPIAPLAAGKPAFDVVSVGECSLDLVGLVESFPAPGDKIPLEQLVTRVGGQAATAAVGCRRLGWKTRFVGVLGRDLWGQQVHEGLEAESVDVRVVWRESVPTRSAVVLVRVESGERTVLSHRPPGLTLEDDERPVSAAVEGRLLLVDAVDPGFSTAAASAARKSGIPTLVDVDRPGPGVEALLDQTDIMIVADGFPEAFTGARSTGAALRDLMARFRPAAVVVTLGADGVLAFAGGRECRVLPPAVAVEDTTGAGDAFRAGFAARWLELGQSASLEALLTFACAAGALNCRSIGAQTSLPRREELDPFL